jgi:hypothetical protein
MDPTHNLSSRLPRILCLILLFLATSLVATLLRLMIRVIMDPSIPQVILGSYLLLFQLILSLLLIA